MIDIPDINVWIALSAAEHIHRERAHLYWQGEAADTIAFNLLTMLGLVRIASKRPVLAHRPLGVAEAWSVYVAWRGAPNVRLLDEPRGTHRVFSDLISANLVSANGVTDAYLAGFAIAGGYRLVSFDRDFARYPRLNFLHLG